MLKNTTTLYSHRKQSFESRNVTTRLQRLCGRCVFHGEKHRMREVHVKWRLFFIYSAHFSPLSQRKTHMCGKDGKLFSVKYLKRVLLLLTYRKSRFKRHLRQYCASSNTCRHFDVTLKDVWRIEEAGSGFWLTAKITNANNAVPPTGRKIFKTL